MQFGPFAVAQLRLFAELRGADRQGADRPAAQALHHRHARQPVRRGGARCPRSYEPIAKSRREANGIKRRQPITVVIGNPPYKEKAEGRGGWVESGTDGGRRAARSLECRRRLGAWARTASTSRTSMSISGAGRRWKVFGSGQFDATGRTEEDEEGCLLHHGGGFPERPRLREDARRPAPHLFAHLGDRLLARRPSARCADAHLSRRAAAGLHRAGGAERWANLILRQRKSATRP